MYFKVCLELADSILQIFLVTISVKTPQRVN